MSELTGPSNTDVAESNGEIVASTQALRVVFTRDPFSLAASGAEGQ